jgi:hypothetical protein
MGFLKRQKVKSMRICIYKTDESPDLTLLLREGVTMPGDAEDANWIQFKIVTPGELRGDLLAKMEPTGHCIVQFGGVAHRERANRLPKIGAIKDRTSLWKRFPNFLGRMSRI